MSEPNWEEIDPFPATLSLLLFVFVIGLVTFLLFPALVYYSVIAYGLFASSFMALSYLVWLALVRKNPKKARGFLIGFVAPVVLVLAFYLTALPWLVALITGEFAFFWLVVRLIANRVSLHRVR
jgi:hypothetical protein